MAHPIDRAAETGDNFLRPLSGCTLRDQKVVCEVLFRASSRGLRAVWLCNNKFASKGGFLAAQKEDAWQFSTSTFWSLSVQSFIALESRLLISPPFFFCAPLSQWRCFSQHTRRNSSQPLRWCYRHLRYIAWTLKIHPLLAMGVAMSLQCRC